MKSSYALCVPDRKADNMLISTNSGLYSARPNELRVPMADAMRFFGQASFEAVDVNFCAVIYTEPFKHEPVLDGDWQKNMDEVLAAIHEAGLQVSHTHLPFYDMLMEDKERLDFCNRMMTLSIDASAYIGAPYAVVHPLRDSKKTLLTKETIDLMRPFAEYARAKGVTLCMENMYTTSAEEIIAIADALQCGICWDAGHANFGGFEQYASVMKLGDRLKVLHLHDNYGTRDDHSLPYLGTLDWDSLLRALKDVGYKGTFNYEVAASKLPMALRMDHARYMVDAARDMLAKL